MAPESGNPRSQGKVQEFLGKAVRTSARRSTPGSW